MKLTAKKLLTLLLQQKADEKNMAVTVLMPDDTVVNIVSAYIDVVNNEIRLVAEGESPDESPDTIGNYETLTEEL